VRRRAIAITPLHQGLDFIGLDRHAARQQRAAGGRELRVKHESHVIFPWRTHYAAMQNREWDTTQNLLSFRARSFARRKSLHLPLD
jgi:hypothetical protein